jgi:hypothetical protein
MNILSPYKKLIFDLNNKSTNSLLQAACQCQGRMKTGKRQVKACTAF